MQKGEGLKCSTSYLKEEVENVGGKSGRVEENDTMAILHQVIKKVHWNLFQKYLQKKQNIKIGGFFFIHRPCLENE